MKIMKVFQYYITVVSAIMFIQFVMMIIMQNTNRDFSSLKMHTSVLHFFGYLFYFSMWNIIFVFVSGIWFLFDKERRKVGVFALICLASFLYLLFIVSNDF